MRLNINNEIREISDVENMEDILKKISPDIFNGIAVAVNEQVIPKSDWKKFLPKENDRILIIKASQGG